MSTYGDFNMYFYLLHFICRLLEPAHVHLHIGTFQDESLSR